MTLYKPGETSEAVKNKKNKITKSMLKKAELINSITSFDEIYKTLNISNNSISESAVHMWNDTQLDIISYSWNTAHAIHNTKPLKLLQKAITNANNRIFISQKVNKKNTQQKPIDNTNIQLRKENAELKIALAEVYRAYMHLVETYREDQMIDNAIRQLILEQAKILGKHRVSELK